MTSTYDEFLDQWTQRALDQGHTPVRFKGPDADYVKCQECGVGGQDLAERCAKAEDLSGEEVLDSLNEAERLGLVVGAAYGQALAERDEARAQAVDLGQRLEKAMTLLRYAVAEWPETTWASDSFRKDHLIQGTKALEDVDSEESPTTEEQT